MKTSRYSDSQILGILKQAAGGVPVSALCREHGMSSATFYKWRAKYGGMDASLMARMKELEKMPGRAGHSLYPHWPFLRQRLWCPRLAQ